MVTSNIYPMPRRSAQETPPNLLSIPPGPLTIFKRDVTILIETEVVLLKNIRFLKDPGYTYDLFYIFIHYFNREYVLANFSNFNAYAEDVRFSEKMLEEFPDIPEELRLFFHIDDNPHTFITSFYFDPHQDDFLKGTYSLATIQNELMNYDQVVTNVLRHYFRNEPAETLQKCKESLPAANALIKNSSLDTRVKSALYSFLIDPIPVIQRLSHELMAKEFLLSKQYEKHSALMRALQENFDFPAVAEKLKTDAQHSSDIDDFDEVVVSFCYYNKNHICLYFYKDAVLLALGRDYIDILQYLIDKKFTPKLNEFGTAVSEENRAAILQFLHENGESTIKEVEQALHLAGTNAYYHINLMIRAGLIKTRNSGRKSMYSINHQYFTALIEVLKSYTEESKKEP